MYWLFFIILITFMVSIIIPFKNPMPYFEDCLKSVINQTYVKLQIILVNDGSEDQSLELAKKMREKDSRIEILKNISISNTKIIKHEELFDLVNEFIGNSLEEIRGKLEII